MKMIVDPYIVALPCGDELDKERVLEWAERFVAWNTDFPKNLDTYVVSHAVYEQLLRGQLIPFENNVRQLFKRYGITEYDAHTVVGGSCSSNLSSMSTLEDEYSDDQSLDEQYEFEDMLPEAIRGRLTFETATAFVQSLLKFYFAKVRENCTFEEYSIATSLEHDSSEPAELVIRLTRLVGEDLVADESRWRLVRDPDYVNVTRNTADYYEKSLQDALDIAISKLRVRGILKHQTGALPAHEFGEHFQASITELIRNHSREIHRDAVGLIFEAICHVLVGDWPYNGPLHHKLREGVGRDDVQIVRPVEGGRIDRAIRVRVECRLINGNEHHLHVHYWQRADRVMEFSNVTFEHDDDTIY